MTLGRLHRALVASVAVVAIAGACSPEAATAPKRDVVGDGSERPDGEPAERKARNRKARARAPAAAASPGPPPPAPPSSPRATPSAPGPPPAKNKVVVDDPDSDSEHHGEA